MNCPPIQNVYHQDEKRTCIYQELLKNIYACRRAFNNQSCTICLQIESIKEIKTDSGKRQQLIRKYETY